MQTRPRASKPRRAAAWRAVLCGTALALAAQSPAIGAKNERQTKPPASSEAPAIADKQADLQELRGRIESLRKELAASEEHKSEAADKLRESERQISSLQRELRGLTSQRAELQATLRELTRQSAELETRLGQQQAQLEKLVYRQYLRGNPDALQLLLNGNDPNQLARDLHYLSAIARARSELLGEIRQTLDRKKALSTDARERADELATVEAEQKQRHAELEKQRQQRQATLSQISDRIQNQRKEIGSLQQNEKRLSQLIDRLSRILAAQAAAARAKAKAAAEARAKPVPETRQEPSRPTSRPDTTASEPTRPRTVEIENRHEPEAVSGAFARLKGSLRLPVRGMVAGRFGSPRDGGGTWKGLFIRSGAGSEVKSVAGGRVVFSEWMRGFGNLLIVDHGDSYLSIYGNNDSLLKQVGEAVKGGETVATVGNSGGNPETGLYFEIRHQGQPLDPMKWANVK